MFRLQRPKNILRSAVIHLFLIAAPESFIVDDSDNEVIDVVSSSCGKQSPLDEITESDVETAPDAATERFKLVIVESDTEALKTSDILCIHRKVTVTVPVIFSVLLLKCRYPLNFYCLLKKK